MIEPSNQALIQTIIYVLTRTQIVDFFTVTNGGGSFVTKPTIELVGGGGSGAVMDAIIDNEVIQAITIANPGRGYSSTPAVQSKNHTLIRSITI